MTSTRTWIAVLIATFVGGLSFTLPASAQPLKTYNKKAAYDDVRFDLTNAIVDAGLAVAANGKIADMLDRTGEAVGSTKQVYLHGEYFTFCSAKYSRAMVEADPLNIAFCPTTIFMFETAANPGTVVVGYRRPVSLGPASDKAVSDTEALLDKIARQAVQ
jgi:uncharacterized protein (DUF302 family)